MVHSSEPVILTIARQMASGGSYIGYAVASKLHLKYLNREILRRAAEVLRVEDPRALESLEESRGSIWARLSRGIAMGAPEAPFVPAPLRYDEDDLFDVESRIIRAVAEHEDAVIVGHGAAYVLRDHPGVMRVFVHAPEPWRIAAAQRTYGLDFGAARALVRRSDERRSRFIEGLSGAFWTDARLYDIAVDTSAIDVSVVIEWFSDIVKSRLRGRHPMSHAES
jgi:cytidylate kinase